MKKEMENHRNDFFVKNPGLLLNQCTRHHEIAIGKKLLVSIELMSLSHWRKKLEFRERNIK
jgi:hypothetical protein